MLVRSYLKNSTYSHCEALFAEVPLFGSASMRDRGWQTISILRSYVNEIARLPLCKRGGGQASLHPFGASLAMTLEGS